MGEELWDKCVLGEWCMCALGEEWAKIDMTLCAWLVQGDWWIQSSSCLLGPWSSHGPSFSVWLPLSPQHCGCSSAPPEECSKVLCGTYPLFLAINQPQSLLQVINAEGQMARDERPCWKVKLTRAFLHTLSYSTNGLTTLVSSLSICVCRVSIITKLRDGWPHSGCSTL